MFRQAGQSGGNSILFAKSIGEVFKTIAQVWEDLPPLCHVCIVLRVACVNPTRSQVGISGGDLAISAFMVVGMAGCVFLQLRTLNEGLRRFDALFILPIYQVRGRALSSPLLGQSRIAQPVPDRCSGLLDHGRHGERNAVL